MDRSGDSVVAEFLAGLALLLIAQSLAGVIWLTRMGSRTSQNELDISRLTNKIAEIDKEGTRALGIVEDRQKTVIERVSELEERVDHRGA